MQSNLVTSRESLRPGFSKSVAAFMFVLSLLFTAAPGYAGTRDSVAVGDQAPDFTLKAQDGKDVSLKDFLGKKSVVLYFYPKDNTAICTKEACSFRDAYKDFTDAGAEVLGVSSDDEKSHEGFAEKQRLPFKLLSDPGAQVRKLYGVPSTIGMIPGRVTYVIDKGGIIRLTFNSQTDAQKHVTQALGVLKEIDKDNSPPKEKS